ncbi:hypothetical protein BCR44DRAFT_37694 [Catenaria anguillulae PL171]|uniref:Symplekin tight junction protein C terminal-domain-containing protein n=1 Tax=Catenaria anguillulae PL171 TaxID=765915 RepID=A0A1Y2I4T8_9FUNG|nr:hypothetical protein BCR44DRAFT_37694 [Catenaria anguillulae PL171]
MSTPASLTGMDPAALAQALSTPQGVVGTIQAAFALPDMNQKVALLRMAADSALNVHPQLVAALIQQILPTLTTDPSPAYREWLVGFVDDALTNQGLDFNSRVTIACQVVQPICDRLRDPAPVVIKAAVKAFGGLAVVFFEKAIIDPSFASTWQSMLQIRDIVLPYIVSDSTTEGVKLAILKFIQVLTLLLSHAPNTSPPPQHRPNMNLASFPSLARVPPNHPTMRVADLTAAGNAMVTGLVQIMVMPVNSAQIVTACISLLTELAKDRPAFTPSITKGLLSLITSAQRDRAADKIDQASILRTIKISLLGLVNSPHIDRDVRNQVIQALEGLGARWHEIQHRPSLHTPVQPNQVPRSATSTPPLVGGPGAERSTPPVGQVQRGPQPPAAPIASAAAAAAPARRDPDELERARQERLALSQAIQQTLPLASLALPIVVELIVQSMQVVPRDEALYAIERLEQELRALPQQDDSVPEQQSSEGGSRKRKRGEDVVKGKQEDEDEDMIVPDEDDDENDDEEHEDGRGDTTSKRRRGLFQGLSGGKPSLDPLDAFRALLAAEHKLSDDGHLASLPTTSNTAHAGRKPLRTNTGRSDWIRKLMSLIRSFPPATADACRGELAAWVLADVPARGDVALAWILHEWRVDAGVAHAWHMKLVEGVFEHPSKVDPKDIKLVRLIVDVPPPPAVAKPNPSEQDMDVDGAAAQAKDDVLMARIRDTCLHHQQDDAANNGGTSGPLLIPLIRALKEFVDFSPVRRDAALGVLFEMAQHANKLIRSPAVIALKKYFPDNAVLGPRVREFAAGGLAKLVQEITPEQVRAAVVKDEKENADAAAAAAIAAAEAKVQGATDGVMASDVVAKPAPAAAADSLDSIVLARAGLMLALCSRDASLLSEILGAYAQLAHVPEVQAVIRSQVTPLIRALVGQYVAEHPGELPPGLINVITTFPAGAESLALRILVVLTECVAVTNELVEAVKRVHDERALGGKFLLPVLSHLDKDYILSHLGELVDLVDTTEQSHKVFREATNRICTGDTPQISPADFFLALHDDQTCGGNRDRIRKSIDAIQVCISHTSTFTPATVLAALTSLLDARAPPAWPKLLFRTAMNMYTAHKDAVVTPLKQLLHKAAVREMWTHPAMLEGWLRLYTWMLPSSLALALMLPPNVLVTLLERAPEVREQLVAFIETRGVQNQPRVIAAWPVLMGVDGQQQEEEGSAAGDGSADMQQDQGQDSEGHAVVSEGGDVEVSGKEKGAGEDAQPAVEQEEQTSESAAADQNSSTSRDVESALSDVTSLSSAPASAPLSEEDDASSS